MSGGWLDTPQKTVEFVLIFLPGFVALGLAAYLTNLVLGDLAFTYVSVALSILIYLTANGILAITGKLAITEVWAAKVRGMRVLIIGALTAVSGLTITYLYESGVVVALVRSISPSVFLRTSHRPVLVDVIAYDAKRKVHELDTRPADMRIDRQLNASGDALIARYALFMRVYVDNDNVFEGRPRLFEVGKEKTGFPIVLSQACRVERDKANGRVRFGRINGPGVLITGHDAKFIELYEEGASGCAKCFDSLNKADSTNCFSTS